MNASLKCKTLCFIYSYNSLFSLISIERLNLRVFSFLFASFFYGCSGWFCVLSWINHVCVCVCVSSGLVYTGLDFSEWASTPSPAAQQKQKSRGEPEIAFPRPIKGPSVQRWLPAAVAADKHRYARVKSADVFVCLFYSLI